MADVSWEGFGFVLLTVIETLIESTWWGMPCSSEEALANVLAGYYCLEIMKAQARASSTRLSPKTTQSLQTLAAHAVNRLLSWHDAFAGIPLDMREQGVSRQRVVDALSGLQKNYGNRRKYSAAFSVTTVWLKRAPAKHAPPVPEDAAMACVVQLRQEHDLEPLTMSPPHADISR